MAGRIGLITDQSVQKDYPTDIWKVGIDEKGKWGEPAKLDSVVTSEGSEWYSLVSYDNSLYFSRDLDGNAVIHKAELVNGDYEKVSKLEAAFNYDCGDQILLQNMKVPRVILLELRNRNEQESALIFVPRI